MGVLRDKEIKLEEVEAVAEASHTLGGATSLRSESMKAYEKHAKSDSNLHFPGLIRIPAFFCCTS